MKTKFVIFLILLSQTNLAAIDFYYKGDTLFVWADGGLNLRDSENFNGNKLTLIPYGSKVVSLTSKLWTNSNSFQIEIIPERIQYDANTQKNVKSPSLELTGNWIKIEYDGIVGYVFDAYLSKFEAPLLRIKYGKDIISESLDDYLVRVFGVINKDEKSGNDFVIREIYYNQGISFKNIGTKTAYVKYVLPNFSFQEIILFFKNGIMSHDSSYLIRLIEKESFDNGQIKSLKFKYDMNGDGFLSIKYISNTVIIESDSSC